MEHQWDRLPINQQHWWIYCNNSYQQKPLYWYQSQQVFTLDFCLPSTVSAHWPRWSWGAFVLSWERLRCVGSPPPSGRGHVAMEITRGVTRKTKTVLMPEKTRGKRCFIPLKNREWWFIIVLLSGFVFIVIIHIAWFVFINYIFILTWWKEFVFIISIS